jgi:hypothetical protein
MGRLTGRLRRLHEFKAQLLRTPSQVLHRTLTVAPFVLLHPLRYVRRPVFDGLRGWLKGQWAREAAEQKHSLKRDQGKPVTKDVAAGPRDQPGKRAQGPTG